MKPVAKALKTLGRWGLVLVVAVFAALAALVMKRPRVSLALASAALLLGLAGWGAASATRAVASEPGFRIANAPFSVSGVPAWLDRRMPDALHRAHVAPLEGGVLDRGAAATVARALAASPWVARVESVDLETAPPRILVRLAFREPVARVAWKGAEGWVDAEGVFLPRRHYRLEVDLPLIVGVRKGPPRWAGAPWQDAGLRAGLAVLARFRTEEGLQGNLATALDTIDVGNLGERQGSRPEVVCMTRQGLALRFSAGARPGRATLDEQIGRLRQVLSVDRGLVLPRSYVDLRFGRPAGF